MFYSQFILAKKGPLGTIWIAAHLERKLRKNQVADTDIGVSVDSILFPEVPIALRLSSHLLLGVVRIYSKKVNYLFDDCSDALLKVKQAFRSTAVDLPPEQSKAPYHSITLPETFDLDDFELPDNDIFQGLFSCVTERFGDGDASQIGLDLDESCRTFNLQALKMQLFPGWMGSDALKELFMDKGDAAGTSGILVETDAGPQESTKESSPFKDDDDHNEGISDPPLASNTNNYIIQGSFIVYSHSCLYVQEKVNSFRLLILLNIQAPSTPGLTEEPNLPSAKEEIQVSDDHMDEAAKETASSPVEPSDVGGTELHSNGNVHSMNELDDEKEKTLGTETMEFISSGLPQPATFDKHTEATNGQDDAENQIIIAADVESRGCCDVDEIGTIATAVPVPEDGLEAQGCESYAGCSKTDLNGIDNHHPLHDCEAEYNKSFVGPAVLGTVDVVTSASEHQNFLNLKNAETSESNIDEKSSGFATPVLQACSTKVLNACGSKLPGQEDGLNSAVISEREDATDVAGISTTDRDVEEPTSKADQIAHGVTCATDSNIGEQSDNLIAEENHIEKENNLQISDFPPTEVLLSMPNLPAGVSGNIFVDSTPGNEFFAKDDDIDENVLSGRKRSFAESTLTIQSLNSVESSGGAQSKGTVESVPDDNDLLSSILVGRRSTTFIMKPTPPIPDTVRAKRQQTAARSLTHKRKVLVDDSTVLHGDTIRQQLTDTEDIRRVRKKAPCTKLEVWMLQKQFLEDGVFTEPVFTGMFPVLRSLDDEAIDLNGITIYRDEGTKGASEADISIKSVRGEETEDLGTVVPSNADISRSKLDEETEPMGTLVPSIAAGEGGGILLETSFEQESASVVDGSSMLKEVEIVVNEVTKQMSPHDVSVEKADMKVDDVRSPVGGEAIHSVTLEAVPVSAPDVNCKSTEDTIDCSPSLNKSSDVIIPMHIDASGEVLDQRCAADCTIGDASTAEGVSGSGIRDIGVDVGVSGNVDLDERSGGEHLMEKREGVDSSIEMRDFQDTCSLAVQNSTVSESLALEDTACLISDQAVDNSHPDELGTTNKNDTSGSGLKVDGSCLSSNIICEDVKVDLSHSVEADLSSRVTTSNEREGLQYWEADLNIVTDSTSIPSEYIDTGNNAEFGTDAIEHDTEEKRILDNSGWSSRTRAVANYLQVLFEKESDQAKKAISLDSLLVGKTRKEASRMFFETLVLKTKDYVQAEQETAFYDIKINPRGKLLKSEF
uniref:Sister chromatid cohesion 1 protein 4-like n=1 Tax=Chenopodium quinoa TaxID=63459 RepID=A0A803KMK7_CHEQI